MRVQVIRGAVRAVEPVLAQAATAQAERVMGGRPRRRGPAVPWWAVLVIVGAVAGFMRGQR